MLVQVFQCLWGENPAALAWERVFADLSPPLNHITIPLLWVTCLGNYLKPLQNELGNKAPVVFSVIPKKILLVFNR